MIAVSGSTFFIIYLFAWLLLILILWLREKWRQKANEWDLSQKKPYICPHCKLTFMVEFMIEENTENQDIICPRCQKACVVSKHR